MPDTERPYAQIQKESLMTMRACKKLAPCILGKHFVVESDYKPLIPLLGTKNLDILSLRIRRFRLHMDSFQSSITHVPGKELYKADTLSQAPTDSSNSCEKALQEETEFLMEISISHIPGRERILEKYRMAQTEDQTCSRLTIYTYQGVLKKHSIGPDL